MEFKDPELPKTVADEVIQADKDPHLQGLGSEEVPYDSCKKDEGSDRKAYAELLRIEIAKNPDL